MTPNQYRTSPTNNVKMHSEVKTLLIFHLINHLITYYTY